MTFDRVLNFINKNNRTLVYIDSGVVRCARGAHKSVNTVLKNKNDKYQVVGFYDSSVELRHLEEDLLYAGIKD
jgi:hypothetical protein